ncbi:MAG: hypothetical protein WBR26_22585 [Candidatus Acidiferrum sp.]
MRRSARRLALYTFHSPAPYFFHAEALREMRRRHDLPARRRLLVRGAAAHSGARGLGVDGLSVSRVSGRKNKSR